VGVIVRGHARHCTDRPARVGASADRGD
jgi:hypothetical protein